MRKPILIVPICAIAIMVGCASARIESNIRPGYKEKINKVYILLSTSSAGSHRFMEELKGSISLALTNRGVENKTHVYNNLGLDEANIIKSEIAAYQPKFIIDFVQTSKSVSGGNGKEGGGGTFELTLHETGNETPVWKASLSTTGSLSFAGNAGSSDTTTEIIIKKLAADGLI